MFDSGAEPEFTGILYGIVASNALFRLSYDLGLRNWMLLFAFFVLATDWAEYRISTRNPPDEPGKYLLQFALDILLLVLWTVLTIVPATDIPVFLGIVAAFVLLQGIWDRLLYGSSYRGLFVQGAVETVLSYTVLLGLAAFFGLPAPVLLALGIAVFLGTKIPVWRRLYGEVADAQPVVAGSASGPSGD